MTTEKKLEAQYNKVMKLASKKQEEGNKLDSMINKKWGFNYSEMDLDEIIDTLDYGIGNTSYEHFKIIMDEAKKEKEEEEKWNGKTMEKAV